MFSLLLSWWCCPWIQLTVSEFYFYEKVQDSFALKIKNSVYQCHAGWAKKQSRLGGDTIKNKKQPFATEQTRHWGSYFCQYRYAVLWMIFYCFANYLLYRCIIIKVGGLFCFFTTIWKVWPPPPRGWWGPPTVNLLKRPLLSVAAPPVRKFLIPSLMFGQNIEPRYTACSPILYAASIGVVKKRSVKTNDPLEMHLRKANTTLSPKPQLSHQRSVSPVDQSPYTLNWSL